MEREINIKITKNGKIDGAVFENCDNVMESFINSLGKTDVIEKKDSAEEPIFIIQKT